MQVTSMTCEAWVPLLLKENEEVDLNLTQVKKPVIGKSKTTMEISSKSKPPVPLKKRTEKIHIKPPVIEAEKPEMEEDMQAMFKRIMGPLDKTLFFPTGKRLARAIETGI